MTTVEQLIGDLLLRHNCVIVPSFGGFVAKRQSAIIDYNSGLMKPPSKSLLFNKQLLNNDGLLVNEFALANDIDYVAAESAIGKKVIEWNDQLKNGGRIELDRVGFLYNDQEQNLCFEQDRFFNLLLESFGLKDVHFLSEEDVKVVEHNFNKGTRVAVETESTIEEPVISIKKEENEVPVVELQPKRKTWKYIAAACIIPLAFYSIWIPMKTDVLESGVLSFSDFNPFHQKVESSYEPSSINFSTKENGEENSLSDQLEELPEEVDVYTYQYNDITAIAVETSANKNSVDSGPEATEESFEAHTIHYIVGCFGNEQNAINLVEKLQENGLDGKIIGVVNGLHRVSAGGSISVEGLADIKESVQSIGLKGWTLK